MSSELTVEQMRAEMVSAHKDNRMVFTMGFYNDPETEGCCPVFCSVSRTVEVAQGKGSTHDSAIRSAYKEWKQNEPTK